MIRPRRLLLALLLLLVALPTAASAERVASLPAIVPVTSVRFEVAEALDGVAYIVGRGEVIAPHRMHYVLQTIPDANEAPESVEVIICDGLAYLRHNDDELWQAQLVSGPINDPVAELVAGAESAGPIEALGSVTIDGIVTQQYHIVIDDAQERPFTAADLWIGEQTAHLYQSQVTQYRAAGDQLFQLETVVRDYALNDPAIAIAPPDPGSVGSVRGPVPWSLAARGPISARQLSPLALHSWRDRILAQHSR